MHFAREIHINRITSEKEMRNVYEIVKKKININTAKVNMHKFSKIRTFKIIIRSNLVFKSVRAHEFC